MPLLQQTKDLLRFLHKNPVVRARIAAPPNCTLLYAGHFLKPMWKEVEQLKLTRPELASKVLLPDVLKLIHTPGQSRANLLEWANAIDALVPWKENGFIAWRALSGIFAANAVGTVSFLVGSNVEKSNKVFAATELPVLLRNPNIDDISRDLLSYFQRCVQRGEAGINLGYISA